MQLPASEEGKQLEKHRPPLWLETHCPTKLLKAETRWFLQPAHEWSHTNGQTLGVGIHQSNPKCFFSGAEDQQQPVASSFLQRRPIRKKSFPLTRRPRWAFSKTHNSNSQRNYCNLSEDSFKVVQRISGLGLPSIQALETTKFPWLRYFCNKVRHLCSFSNFSKERGANLYFREFAFFRTTLLTLFNNRKYGAAFLVIHQPRRSLQHLSGCSLGQEVYCALKFKRGQHFTQAA